MLWLLQYSQCPNNNVAKLGESQCVCHIVRTSEDVAVQGQRPLVSHVQWTCTSFPMQGPELGASRGRPERRCFSWCHCWPCMSGCKVRRWGFAFPIAGKERCRRDKAADSDGTANGGVSQETDWRCTYQKKRKPYPAHFSMYVSFYKVLGEYLKYCR